MKVSTFIKIASAIFFPILLAIWIEKIIEAVPFIDHANCISNELLLSEGIMAFIAVLCYSSWIWEKAYIPFSLVYVKALFLVLCLTPLVYGGWVLGSTQMMLFIAIGAMLIVDFVQWGKRRLIIQGKSGSADVWVRDYPVATDDYNRKSYAQRLVDAIVADSHKPHGEIQCAFTINLDEDYGRGKSSLFMLVRNLLKDTECLYFDFFPWRSASSSNVTESFFSELENVLSPYIYAKEKRNLRKYSKSVISYTSRKLDLPDFSDAISSKSSLNSQFDEISRLLREKVKQPIVVLIDDVDRLKSDELWTVLSLIRNTADFPYLYYILAADRNYMIKMLSPSLGDANEVDFFLQKIINLNLLFPSVDDGLLKSSFQKKLSQILTDKGVPNSDITEILGKLQGDYISSSKWDKVFTTFRDINRFFSMLQMDIAPYSAEIFKNQIFAEDFVMVEMVKYLRADVFKILRDVPSLLLDSQMRDHRYVLNSECKRLVSRDLQRYLDRVREKKEDPLKSEKVREINDISEEKSSKSELISAYVYHMLNEMFYDNVNYQEERSIRRWKAFDLYFSFELHSNMITFTKFLSIFSMVESDEKQLLEIIKEHKEDSFYHHLRQVLQHPDGITDKVYCLKKAFDCVRISAKYSKHIVTLSDFYYVKDVYESRIANHIYSFFGETSEYHLTDKNVFFDYLISDRKFLYCNLLLVNEICRFQDNSIFSSEENKQMCLIICGRVLDFIKKQAQPQNQNSADLMDYCSLSFSSYWREKLFEYMKADKENFTVWLMFCLHQNSTLNPEQDLRNKVFTYNYRELLGKLKTEEVDNVNSLIDKVIAKK